MGSWHDAKVQGDQVRVGRLTDQAIARAAGGPLLYVEVIGSADRDRLLHAGWELIDSNRTAMVNGTSLFTKTLMRRPNPEAKAVRVAS
jgi:hypothetical protein